MNSLSNILDLFKTKRVLIIGDAMIDAYMWGDINRMSPEAPIPIVEIAKQENRLGGAANVLQSLSSFYPKNKIDFVFQIGTSVKYKNFLKTKLIKLCKPIFFYSKKTKTTIKTRYYFNDKQIFRIDDESIKNNLFLKKIKSFINLKISKYNKVIISDYNKGFVTKELLQYFSELKNAEILRERLNLANEVSPYVGKYFSVEYIRKNVLRQSDEDIIEIDNQIRNEIKQGIIAAPEGQDMQDEDENTDINIGDN